MIRLGVLSDCSEFPTNGANYSSLQKSRTDLGLPTRSANNGSSKTCSPSGPPPAPSWTATLSFAIPSWNASSRFWRTDGSGKAKDVKST